MKVRNLVSERSGRGVANQFIIKTDYATYFQSYDSIIARRENRTGKISIDKNYWNYSSTTSKYRNQFLNETTEETQKKIDDNTYILCDLNSDLNGIE